MSDTKIETWILTFNRPEALNRLIRNLNTEGIVPHVFSNHPKVTLSGLVSSKCVVNTLNSEKSNSWCARSWNSIYLKAFMKSDGVICIQDDTDIKPGFGDWISRAANMFDFVSGPAGDQFHYIHKRALQRIGWWDERYIGCYCGDADYFKRAYLKYDRDKVSQVDTHNWGWVHNPCGLGQFIDTEYQTKTCDADYENQHWALDKLGSVNKTLLASQAHYKSKWGVDLDCGRPAIAFDGNPHEIDWYPWATKEFGIQCY